MRQCTYGPDHLPTLSIYNELMTIIENKSLTCLQMAPERLQLLKVIILLLSFQFANLFENNSSAEWTLYISEWSSGNSSMEQSNIRVTTKVAVNALLGDTPTLQEYGSAIMHNLGTKEVNSAVRIFNIYENRVWFKKYICSFLMILSKSMTQPVYHF